MVMAQNDRSDRIWRRVAYYLAIVVIGVPAAWMIIIGTWGTVLIPLQFAIFFVPYALLNYVLWGWWMRPKPSNATMGDEPRRETQASESPRIVR